MTKMNDNNQIEDITAKAELLENVSEDVEEINLAGYQVTIHFEYLAFTSVD